MRDIFDFPVLISALADSLFLNTERYNKNVFDSFFVERIDDIEFLESRLANVSNYGGNVLVVGEPGVGKTLFLKRFLDSPRFKTIAAPGSKHTLIDLRPLPYDRNQPSEFIDAFKARLVDVILSHLQHLEDPCHEVRELQDVAARYQLAAHKVTTLALPARTETHEHVHYLFVDDVDYIDDVCFSTLLELLRPLLLSRYFCVIIACRVPAYNAVQSHRDYIITTAFEDAKTLHLSPLRVSDILSRRIAVLTNGAGGLRSAVTTPGLLGAFHGVYTTIVSCCGELAAEDDIARPPYPFTGKQHHYMQTMSNGNIREILLMAAEFLKYMAANRGAIHVDPTGGYWVGRKAVIQMFADPACVQRIRIQDLHSQRTFAGLGPSEIKRRKLSMDQVGNSVFVLVLETVRRCEYPNRLTSTVLTELHAQYGVSEVELKQTVETLSDLGLVRPRALHGRVSMGAVKEVSEWDLTARGHYYLDYLLHWDEYIARFGISRHHRQARSYQAREAVKASLLEMAINIMIEAPSTFDGELQGKLADFRISKEAFAMRYRESYRDVIAQLDETDKYTMPKIPTQHIESYLAIVLDIIEQHNIEHNRAFLFKTSKIGKAAREAGVPLQVRYIYDKTGFDDFVKTHVKPAEYEIE